MAIPAIALLGLADSMAPDAVPASEAAMNNGAARKTEAQARRHTAPFELTLDDGANRA